MKPRLILLSHGHMAKETLESAKMVVGEIINAQALSMTAEEGIEGITQKLTTALNDIPENESILIIADLLGGTPGNVAMIESAKHTNIEIITGMNLTMVLEYALSSIEDVQEMADFLIEVGHESIQKIEKKENEGNIENDEDGYED